jgi:NAD+ diphosphatase
MCKSILTHIKTDNLTIQKCAQEDCDFVNWNNPIPVVAAIIEYKHKMLLVRKSDWPKKTYGLVTGFLESKESPKDAIKREIYEEVNLSSSLPELVGIYPFEAMNQLLIVYSVMCQGDLKLDEELSDYKMIDKTDFKPWSFGTGFAVKDWILNQK